MRTCLTTALLVVGFAVLYVFTAQRGVSWGDSGVFQLRILGNDQAGSSGLALAHPLFVATAHFLSRLVPEPFRVWSMNAICGIWGALAVGMMFLCAQRLLVRRAPPCSPRLRSDARTCSGGCRR